MKPGNKNSFKSLKSIKINNKDYKYFSLAESLGGIESLICHPATMTHASIDKTTKTKLGIDDSLVRLSIGCEDYDDLITDILIALKDI